METSNCPNCRTNVDPQIKADRQGVHDGKINMQDYFKSSVNRIADKGASEVITNKIYNVFSNVFSRIGCNEGTFALQVNEGS